MSIRVFIDGSAGTTGLRLTERLSQRAEIELLQIDPALRKDDDAKAALANTADIVFLCLPDEAAKKAVAKITNPAVRVIDASTAHRTAPGWAYGLPELSAAHRTALQSAGRVSVPGCHATGFIVPVYPLIAGGIAAADFPFCCHSVTGYSGGGKAMIAEYESGENAYVSTPRQYGLGQTHKHLPEMQAVPGLAFAPVFSPILSNYYSGMVTTVPLHRAALQKKLGAAELHRFFSEYYAGQPLVRVMPWGAEQECAGGMLDSGVSDCDRLDLYVCGNDERVLLISRFDNLGKGSSGAAVQCMNIVCGLGETTGLAV